MPWVISDAGYEAMREGAWEASSESLRLMVEAEMEEAVKVEQWPVDSVAHQQVVEAVWVQMKEDEESPQMERRWEVRQ